jgi:hypothetical protein
MDILTIKTRIGVLKKSFPDPSQNTIGCKELIILKYSQSVLNKLEKIICEKKNFQDAIFDLQSLLSNNWEFVKGNLLCYTALPCHEVTEFLCELSLWIAEFESKRDKPLSAIKVLMPTIHCDSLNLKRYPNLDEANLKKVIQTHILGSNHHYLLPISLLGEIEKNKDTPNAKIYNPYFDVFSHEENPALSSVFLGDKDIKRLYAHSDSTKSIRDAIYHYQLSINQSSLLKQMKTLIHGLEYNSVRGIGQEESAAIGGYNALIAFMNFWYLLSNQLAVIPPILVEEINLLLQLTTNAENNAKYSIETCLATRRDELFKKIAGHEEILNAITISNEKKENLIQENIQQLKNAVNNLESHLQNGNYVGRDPLGITTKILTELKIPLNSAYDKTLAFILKEMELEEVLSFCVLERISDKNFLAILNHFNPNHYPAVYEALQEKLPSIVKNAHNFSEILKVLSPDRKIAACQFFKTLFVLIKNTEDFNQVFYALEFHQRDILCVQLKTHWPIIVKTSNDLCKLLKLLMPAQHALLCESLVGHWSYIIKDAKDLQQILANLSFLEHNQYALLCDALKDHLPSIIKNREDFSTVFNYINSQKKEVLLTSLRKHFPMTKNLDKASQANHFPAPKPATLRFFSRIFQLPKYLHFGQRFHPAPRP